VQRSYSAAGVLLDTFPALNPTMTVPTIRSTKPTVTQAPTKFGSDTTGAYPGTTFTRPPDLRLPYSLGDIAEGNPWQADTYYPVGAKVAVGVWVDDPLNERLVWVATRAGKSSSQDKKPEKLQKVAVLGDTVEEGVDGVKWEARKAPTSEEIANYVLDKGISIAKISMADLKFRIDSVNGGSGNANYSIPFVMLQNDGKNKITIELWIDDNNNRIHLIRVNDVLALVFNDRYLKGKYNILPNNWTPGGSQTFGTGLRVWNAAAKFHTAENYGQTLKKKNSANDLGEWRR
jgi:hypothetical protein